MSNNKVGKNSKFKENINTTIRKGFSLIKNLKELKLPNLTVYSLERRSGLEP